MKAAVVKEFGKPLSIETVDIPSPSPSHILINVGSLVDFLKKGDTVGIPWLYCACGRCEYCIDGMETLCPSQLTLDIL